MPVAVVSPRRKGFIMVNAHPAGCAAEVDRQFDAAAQLSKDDDGSALVVGSSTGYGLASRIGAAGGLGKSTVGVFLEREPTDAKPGSAGWYNDVAFQRRAVGSHVSLNADAFAETTKLDALRRLRELDQPVSLFVYSVASPVRLHPSTGQRLRSAIKPIGAPYATLSLDIDTHAIRNVEIPAADEQEIAETIAVMGGEDFSLWFDALRADGLLSPDARVFAYSYIGPEMTWSIYRDGTIGRAKADLERHVERANSTFPPNSSGGAWVSVNKAVVTQASSAIPSVPLYISILFEVMKRKGLHEDTIDQVIRLMSDNFASTRDLDAGRRIRLDDWEMRRDVQGEVATKWIEVETTKSVAGIDVDAFVTDFERLFGFSVPGINYDTAVELQLRV